MLKKWMSSCELVFHSFNWNSFKLKKLALMQGQLIFFQFVFWQLCKVLAKAVFDRKGQKSISCLQWEQILLSWELPVNFRAIKYCKQLGEHDLYLQLSNPFHCVILFTLTFYFVKRKPFWIMFSQLAICLRLNES